MVKPVVQLLCRADVEVDACPDDGTAPAEGDTRTRILKAAFHGLATRGYAGLNVRDIARDAGVNHALINYHFGGKDRLVIAVLDEANRQLLQRQRGMYAAPGGFADKWGQARRFYESDLATGFVRVQAELWAASLSNPALREQFLPRVQAWKQVVGEAVQQALAAHRPTLPPAFSAEAIGCLISEFWLGMEFSRLIGAEAERVRHEKALDAVEALLLAMESGAGVQTAAPAAAGNVRAAALARPRRLPASRLPRSGKEKAT
ncbi:MAG: TetR/AcrR family transcriptional regulator [Rubrivivax sp.]